MRPPRAEHLFSKLNRPFRPLSTRQAYRTRPKGPAFCTDKVNRRITRPAITPDRYVYWLDATIGLRSGSSGLIWSTCSEANPGRCSPWWTERSSLAVTRSKRSSSNTMGAATRRQVHWCHPPDAARYEDRWRRDSRANAQSRSAGFSTSRHE